MGHYEPEERGRGNLISRWKARLTAQSVAITQTAKSDYHVGL